MTNIYKATYGHKYVYNILGKIKSFKKPFCIIFFIYLIGISAILRADFNYIDDFRRASEGYRGWDYFSRYMSDSFSVLLNGGTYLTDISPLTQIIAVALMAVAAVIVLDAVTEKNKFEFWDYVAIIPLGLSPYFLECLSYKFDSPHMALSVLASVFPVLFRKQKRMLYVFSIFLCTLIMCTTYQASSGIFPMLVVLTAFKQFNKKENTKNILNFVLASAAGYLLGLGIFALFIMKPTETYVSNSVMLSGTVDNLKNYFLLIKADFRIEWIVLTGLLCAGFICTAVLKSGRSKLISFLAALISVFVMLVLSFGVYAVLEKPLFSPRAMYGFGVFIAFIGIYAVNALEINSSKAIILILSWMFFVFSFTYGNALSAHKDYAEFRMTSVIEDLKDLDFYSTDAEKKIQIMGDMGYSPALENLSQEYPILKRLVPNTFTTDTYWGWCSFANYYGPDNISRGEELDKNLNELLIIKDTMYHTIYYVDEFNILIVLK